MHNWISVIVAVVFTAIVAAVPVSAATLTSLTHQTTSQEVSTAADHTLTFTTPSGVAESETMLVTFDASFDTSSLTEDDVDVADDSVDLTTASDCSGTEEASISIAADVVTITICAGDGGVIAATSEVVIEIGTNATASGTGANQTTNPSNVATYQIRVSGTFGDSGSAWIPIVTTGGIPVSLTIPAGGGGGGGGGEDPPQGDVTPPVISNVQVAVFDDTSAFVTWETNEAANSNVDYGLTESYELGTESEGTYEVNHSITLSDLTPGMLHYFQVRSSDNNGNQATSSGYSFTTTDTTPPVISNIEVVDITTTSARVTWATDENADSYVTYGLDETYGSESEDNTLETEHSIILTGLDEDTTYHFMVRSTDVYGNSTESVDDTFDTLSDPAPANVSNLVVTAGDAQNQLTWINPPDADLVGVWIVYRTDTYPTDENDGTLVFDDLAEEFLHDDLVNGTSYYYGVFAYDLAGQFASGALGFGTPTESEAPPEEDDIPDDDLPDEPPGDDDLPDDDDLPNDDDLPDGDEPAPYCGDGVCGEGEDYENCAVDCPLLDEPETGEVDDSELEFLAAKGSIELFPINELVRTIAGTELRIQLPTEDLSQVVNHVELVFGNDLYLMSLDEEDEVYVADIFTPSEQDAYFVSVTIFYEDGSGQVITYTSQVDSFGYVFETVEDGTERVANATVTLFSNDDGFFEVWDGSEYSELNPITTLDDGSFAWYVPIGEYYVLAEKEGYDSAQTEVLYVTDSIVNPVIELEPLPPEVEEIIEVITGAGPITEIIPEALGMITENLVFVLEEIRENETVVESATIAVPVLIGVSVGSLSLMGIFFNLASYLQYLFTAPLLFFWRRKRKGWGVAYNAVTKVPIDLAIVRLYKMPNQPVPGAHAAGGQLLQTRVTDKQGRYFFLADEGAYRIEVIKPGFAFPGDYLKGVKDDGTYFDIYQGEPIEVTEDEATIAANVPLNPVGTEKLQTPSKIRLMSWLRIIQKYAAALGVLIAVVVAVIIPSVFSVVVAVIQIGVYFLVRQLVRVRKPKGWGIVYDKTTKKPLGGVVVRIFEPKYNKLLETAVTDRKGRYSFLVGPNEYYTRYESKGYRPHEYRPIDLKSEKGPSDIALDVHLEEGKLKAGPTVQTKESKIEPKTK